MNTTNASATGTRQVRVGLKKIALRTASATAILLATTLAAHAQAQLAAAAPEVTDEIIVTGSRIVRDGYEAPTPVSVVGVEEILSSASANPADFVNSLPAFSNSLGTFSGGMSTGTQGLYTLNLRNLGTGRTLVLLDGQRSVPSHSTGAVDVNTFPQTLISRVDVVTGGASSAYGSDAVAGVVNFVLDKTYTGLKGEVGGGITTYGDNETWNAELTYGTPFAGGRGHFLMTGAARRVAGVFINDRQWNLEGWQYVFNPAYGTGAGQSTSVPQVLQRNQVSVANAIVGGIITAGPLFGTAFGEGGRPYQFNYGPLYSAPDMVGGAWRSAQVRGTQFGNGLSQRSKNQNVWTRVAYDLSDNVNVYATASWAHNTDLNWCCGRVDNGNLTVSLENPFIPQEVVTRAAALGVTQFVMGTFNADYGSTGGYADRRVQRYVVGVDGTFDAMATEWTWGAYYQKGIVHGHQELVGPMHRSAFNKARDVVRHPVTGLPTCRVNADASTTNDDRNCVPYNLFGINVNSPDAISYVQGMGEKDFRTEKTTQDVGAINFSGSPFELWAGPVSLAFGAEHRRETITGINDPISQNRDWYYGNFQIFDAKLSVTEGFMETVVPLAVDEAFAKSLEFNGAIRATDYSSSGFVTTWKLGLTWAPIDDLRFRATRSRDIRAPHMQFLYQTGNFSAPSVVNPFRGGVTELIDAITRGNADLKPERSDYIGVGAVVQPMFLPGFSASLDYWKLDIADSIGNLTIQQILDQCFSGNQTFCEGVVFGPGNTVPLIYNQPFNFVTEVASGIDIEAGYSMPADMLVESWSGNMSLRFMATHFIKRYTSNGFNEFDTAGENNAGGPPSWRWRATAGYSAETFDIRLIARGISGGTYNNAWIECTSGCPVSTPLARTVDENDVEGRVYLDTAFTYKFGFGEAVDMEAFLNVQNVMDKDPPVVGGAPGGFSYEQPSTNDGLYDVMGRTFRVGLRFRM